MNKKDQEKQMYAETIKLARFRGGESRRNADKIAGSVTQGECPDFVVELDKYNRGPSAVLAVEHFRVDHFSELNRRSGHQDSLAAIERNRAAMVSCISIEPSYVELALRSPFLQTQMTIASKQTAQANLFQVAIVNLLLTIPPHMEQKRIVKQFELLSPYVTEHEDREEARDRLDTELPDRLHKS